MKKTQHISVTALSQWNQVYTFWKLLYIQTWYDTAELNRISSTASSCNEIIHTPSLYAANLHYYFPCQDVTWQSFFHTRDTFKAKLRVIPHPKEIIHYIYFDNLTNIGHIQKF